MVTKKTTTKQNVDGEHVTENRFHSPKGNISLRGRRFKGTVIKKFQQRVVVSFERTIYNKKYERYAKRKTKIHARLPASLSHEVQIGDYLEVMECRPLSKIIHFMVIQKMRGGEKLPLKDFRQKLHED